MHKYSHAHAGEHTDRHDERLKFFPLELLAKCLKNNNDYNGGDENGN